MLESGVVVVSPRLANLVLGSIGIALGAIVIAVLPGQTGAADHRGLLDPSGPGLFPLLAACVSIAAGLWSLVNARADHPSEVDAGQALIWRRSLPVAGWLGLILLGIATVGFLSAVGVATAGLAFSFGQRRLPVLATLAIGTPLAIYLLFERVLRILFPHGWIF